MKKTFWFIIFSLAIYLIIEIKPKKLISLSKNIKSDKLALNSSNGKKDLFHQDNELDSEIKDFKNGLVFRNEKGDPLYKDINGKNYISARQQMFIQAKDIAKGAVGIGVRKIEVRIDDTNNPYYEYIGSKTQKFSVGNEGEHLIYFRVTDKLNNVSEDFERSVTVDDTPPEPSMLYQVVNPGSYYQKKNVTYLPRGGYIIVGAVDSTSGVKSVSVSRNDEAYKVYKIGDLIPIEFDRLNIIKVRATDNVGNVSAEYIYNAFVDIEAPCLELSSHYTLLNPVNSNQKQKENNIYQNQKEGEKEENNKEGSDRSGADVFSPNEEISLNSNREYPGQTDKNEEFYEKEEEYKNKKTKEYLYEEKNENSVDKDGWCLGKRPKGYYTNIDNKFFLRGYDKDSGLALIEYRIDNGEWNVYKEFFQLKKSGPQNLEIKVTDFVGNNRTSLFKVIVDDLPPRTKVIVENVKNEVIGAGKGIRGEGVEKKSLDEEKNENDISNNDMKNNDENDNDDDNYKNTSEGEIGPRIEE